MRRITNIRVVLSILATPFLVVLYLNIEKWAESRGYDLYLTNLVTPPEGAVVNPVVSYALRPEMSYIALAVVTFMTGIWCDAWLRRSQSKRIPKKERIRNLGDKCLDLVRFIDAGLDSIGHLNSGDKQDALTRMWSEFLPVSIELEKLRLKTPDHRISSVSEADAVRAYLRFIGNLLQNGQLKMAKKTAQGLTEGPGHQDENSASQSLLNTAIGRLRRILPG